MKIILSLSAILITLTLTAQTNTATWYLNDTSGDGIQSPISTASGNFSIAMGKNTTASGDYSTAMGYQTTASGVVSTAMGYATTASGDRSTASGDGTTASGVYSTAMGSGTTASGSSSTAMGTYTTASGDYSTAMGEQTTASGDGSTAMGENTTASGDYSSIAMGQNTVARGGNSTAMGGFTMASGNASTAMGYATIASNYYSTAMGVGTTASGSSSTAMGTYTIAIGRKSTAMGGFTTASDTSSLVIGEYNLLGSTVTNNALEFSTSNTAFVIGNGIDADNRSDALTVLFDGTTTIAGDFNINSDKKVFFGNQSFIEGATEGTVLILNANNNILFRPGGTTTVNFEPNGDAIFNGDVKVTSDKRLKANIISLGSTLAKLLQIDGKTYTMKKDDNKKQKIGVLAQDIEKVFPELVSESNGVKSVNYQGLVPVLINALKEQDTKLNKQQAEIDELKAIVNKLITP